MTMSSIDGEKRETSGERQPDSAQEQAKRLRQALAEVGMTATDAGRESGYSEGYLTRYTRAERPIPVAVAFKLARVLGVRTTWLLTGQGAQRDVPEERVVQTDQPARVPASTHGGVVSMRIAYHCPKCGGELRRGVETCPSCGTTRLLWPQCLD